MHLVEIHNKPLLYAWLFKKAPRLQQRIKRKAPIQAMLGLSAFNLSK
jgi:hypothetical protein